MREIKRIVIYSVGLLGASLGAAFKQSGFLGTIVGISSPKNNADAQKIGAIDYGVGYDEAEAIIADADLLFLCSPINTIIETIEALGKMRLPAGLIISDVGSTKSIILSTAAKYLPSSVQFIGGHPMAGSEKSGAAAADPFLFQNAVYVLSPAENAQETVPEFSAFLQQYLGCQVVALSPDIHDTIAATVSHVPHLIAVSLVNVAEKINREIPGTLDLAAGGFKSLTRIASSPYYMWHDIYQTNQAANLQILDAFIGELSQIKEDLQGHNLKDSFDKAAHTRNTLAGNQKGFMRPLHQITVMAEDRVGFLARMTQLLTDAQLNIFDLELLKVREGEAGTFMIAFGSTTDAQKAIELLNLHHFSARSR